MSTTKYKPIKKEAITPAAKRGPPQGPFLVGVLPGSAAGQDLQRAFIFGFSASDLQAEQTNTAPRQPRNAPETVRNAKTATDRQKPTYGRKADHNAHTETTTSRTQHQAPNRYQGRNSSEPRNRIATRHAPTTGRYDAVKGEPQQWHLLVITNR